MKKLSIIWLSLLCFTLVGCEVESADEPATRTQRGKEIYTAWYESFSSFIMGTCFDNALRFNAYYCAPTDKKYNVEDSLLASYKIRQVSTDTWNLLHDSNVCRTYICSAPINQVGTTWTCTVDNDYAYDGVVPTTNATYALESAFSYTIECVAENTWRIKINNSNQPIYADLAIEAEATPTTTERFAYNFLGEGIVPIYYNNEYIQFSTIEPLHRTTRGWSCGKLDLEVFNTEGDSLETTATFHQSHNNYAYSVDIAYRGLTETYNLSE